MGQPELRTEPLFGSALRAELEPELTVRFGGSGFEPGSELNQSNFTHKY